MTVVWMLIAGAFGAWARYEMAGWIQRRVGSSWPWGTAAVNLAGTVALGLLVAGQQADVVGVEWLTVLGTGFCGAFTTFSTWMAETVHLTGEAGRGGTRAGLLNVLSQLVAGSLVTLALLTLG